ncbi:hypothetical protein [Candidatus Manganitrophus noduliformans]|uniref:Uncharacterized protein n=1 Tax=Candidatus Manganitrophus noduliformans TaxID=2606439 RepID=A0A7X6DMN3_9BACT|nr:hypothetical protein [Candidatus Manganitrophus noduliformans]NKE69960.1 hypothetical protein [Candidatus Manganitrophus noduliformans]
MFKQAVQVRSLPFSHFQPKAAAVQVPKLNAPATAEVGEAMIATENIYTRPAIELAEPVIHSVMLTPLDPRTLKIPVGKLVAAGYTEDGSGVFYQSLTPPTLENTGDIRELFSKQKPIIRGGILVQGQDKPPAYYYHSPFSDLPVAEPDPSIKYITATKVEWEQGSFRKELIYNGRSGNSIKLLYREFKDDFARPAYSQEVTYDFSEGETFGFKGARFKVTDASNIGISYVVLKHLD